MSDLLVPVNGFRFAEQGCEVEGTPSFESWAAAYAQVEHAHRCCGWWLGDLLNYGEAAYGERYVQAVQATGYALQTLMNYKAVCKAIPAPLRVQGLSFSAHRELAFLPAPKQGEALRWARMEALEGRTPTSREVREKAKGVMLGSVALDWVTVRLTEGECRALLDAIPADLREDGGAPSLVSALDKLERALLSF